ncbi:hypothetical protein OLMES_5421 [Oleiphilus messinensis]|uniref:Uncharacterized protein n=1 Tax=Oleiphilus messinensis TaxID=141451 RepID=A0A1Y0IFZ4_9GAMM|nr:hypothetical protein [Oleiphilus messinensis]ARU59401.1 hypothetical protein OLMES_5421 [Oleiphilus messinensis]
MQNSIFHCNRLVILLFILLIPIFSGCSGFMMGYTKDNAQNRYLLVDSSAESLGYQRLRYMQDYRDSLSGFVREHGAPDFIYEYTTDEGREGARLYYYRKNVTYIFEEATWRPSSFYLKNYRALTDYERQTYKQLKQDG